MHYAENEVKIGEVASAKELSPTERPIPEYEFKIKKQGLKEPTNKRNGNSMLGKSQQISLVSTGRIQQDTFEDYSMN